MSRLVPSRRLAAASILVLPLVTPAVLAQKADVASLRSAIAATVDSVVRAGNVAGLTVAVVRGRDTIALLGSGKADLEWNVPMPADAIFEIGSVTKQFTAAAIIQLVEAGKLSLDDDLTKWLPDYDTKGNRVTLRRLLDHTSGIKGVTELPEFGPLTRSGVPRDSVIAVIESKPFDFAPGEALVYNNSAFILLGLVIEKASGQSYADYIKKHIFEPAGMTSSSYCDTGPVLPKRAHGYGAPPGGLRRVDPNDHRYPFSAGSLCSTAGDLIAWLRALHGKRLMSEAGYRSMITPEPLADGTPTRYAKGLSISDLGGHPAIHHGGAIGGFLAHTAYFPGSELMIAVLSNTSGPVQPQGVAARIAELVLGKAPPPPAGSPFTGDVAPFLGEWRGVGRGRETVMTVVAGEKGGLAVQMGSGPARQLRWLGGDRFAEGNGLLTFERKDGQIVRLRVDNVGLNAALTRTAR